MVATRLSSTDPEQGGDFTAESDWDYFGLGGKKPSFDSFQLNGAWVDISVDTSPDPTDVIRLKDGLVVYDERGEGAALLRKVEEVLAEGPSVEEDQISHYKNWIHKTLKRIKRDDTEARYRRHWLLTQLLEDYFIFRKRWYFGSKESLRFLRANDPHTYSLFENALQANSTLEQIEELAFKIMDSNS